MATDTYELINLRSWAQESHSPNNSTRSSFDYGVLRDQQSTVTIFDQAPTQPEEIPPDQRPSSRRDPVAARYQIPSNALRQTTLPEPLKTHLQGRDRRRTQWINIVGWPLNLVQYLTDSVLGGHSCMQLAQGSYQQTLGGPIHCEDGGSLIWSNITLWYTGTQCHRWTSVQRCRLQIILLLPKEETAGTVITNFQGRPNVINGISEAFTIQMLSDHALGSGALSCVWIIAYSLLRTAGHQLDPAFKLFDPLDKPHNTLPAISHLATVLEQANDLAAIDRYTSSLSEVVSFFDAIRAYHKPNDSTTLSTSTNRYSGLQNSNRSDLESTLTVQKVEHVQELCRTYIKQYESFIQMGLSHSTARIAGRLDSGRKLAERLATIGVLLAAISGLTSPINVVTSYYGMNLESLVDGGRVSLVGFWQVAIPVLGACVVILSLVLVRLMTSDDRSLAWKKSRNSRRVPRP